MIAQELEQTRSARGSFSAGSARQRLLTGIPLTERRLQYAGCPGYLSYP